ncbi:MAG: glycosyltransferase family 61 protein [Alphaproteobacteria bacterium]|nr:glycosyltransferase family 61 protein [Alphaproteobacteria bacterium]
MIENFSVMWPFLNRIDPKVKVVCLLQGQEEPKWDVFHLFYSALGIDESSIIFLKQPTRFKKVIVAEQSMELQGKYHPIFKQLFDKVKLYARPAKYKKIYFSKRITSSWTEGSFGLSRHLGEEIAESLFKKNGFYIVRPEKISMRECISLLNGCEIFAQTPIMHFY